MPFQEAVETAEADVIRDAADLMARAVPDYVQMRRRTHELARQLALPHTSVLDLGCAAGEAIIPLLNDYGDRLHYVGVDASPGLVEIARQRFARQPTVEVWHGDLTHGWERCRASVVLCVLTLADVPADARLGVLRRAYDSLLPGGGLLLVEPVLGATPDLNRLFVERHTAHRREAGYVDEVVERQRLGMVGTPNPLAARANAALLARAGFRAVDGYWRCLNVSAWVARKGV